jgi:hypothetical protein
MCIVIDSNTLSKVFNVKDEFHAEFAAVLKWIDEGRGFVVFGGTKYKAELAEAYRYMRIIRQMRSRGQAVSIKDAVVDDREKEVRRKTRETACDDQHIIALLGASHCPLLCSGDSRSFEFAKDRSLYPKGAPRVKIYSSSRNAKLLVPMRRDSLKNVD